jgi:3,4-dihydroxy 2-butanone 4-phosphate synthase/GTP cyclohydrolase II
MTHRLRATHDAILVGIGTILADDPSLTVRLVEGKNPQPVILDSMLRFPLNAKLLQKNNIPWIAHRLPDQAQEAERGFRPERAAALETLGVMLLPIPENTTGGLSLPVLLECLAEMGISSLMVEGGARVITSFLEAGLVDYTVLTVAPLFLGGLPAVEAHERHALHDIEETRPPFPVRLRDVGCERLGDDLVVWGEAG